MAPTHSTISAGHRQPPRAIAGRRFRAERALSGTGFTLVEALVALTFLSVSLLSLAMLFPLEIRLAGGTQTSNEAATLVQRELAQISTHIFDTSGSFVDLLGNTVDVNCQGSPGTSCGNPLTTSGLIDFSQAPPVGFSAQILGADGQQFSVRWNISVTASYGRKIVVAAMALNPAAGVAPVVQYQTLKSP